MIQYNNKYRGPFEYDKFILNLFQIYNRFSIISNEELNENNNLNALINYHNKIDDIYDSIIGTNSTEGLSEKLYKKSFEIEGGF